MTSPVDIRPDQFEIVQAILLKHLPAGVKVWVFGSRANWTTKDSSDLDLALEGESKISHKVLGALENAFEESSLPYTVDVVDLHRLGDSFRQIVESQRAPLLTNANGTGHTLSNGWREATLGECAEFNDATYSPNEGWPFINYLDTGNITANCVDEVQHLDPSNDKIPSRARRKVKVGDIVYSTVRPNQRHYGLLKNVPENFLASTGFAVLRGKEDIADTGFLYQYLTQDHIVDYLHSIAENSTSAYPSIRPSDLEHLTLPLPPLPEQRAIAHVLGTLDDKIELNRRMSETLEAMARALFQDWFVDFGPVRAKMEGREPYLPPDLWSLFPERLVESELGFVPEGWEVRRLGDVVEVVGGTTPSTKVLEYWDGGVHHWATPKDLSSLSTPVLLDTERKITDTGLRQIGSGLLPAGTLLLSSRAPIGYLAVAEVPVAVNQGFIAMPPREGTSNLFMLHWCRVFHEEIVNHANGSTFLEISKSNFRQIRLVLPEAQALREFDRHAELFHQRIVHNERESRALAEQRDALLPRLVSGELTGLGDSDPQLIRNGERHG